MLQEVEQLESAPIRRSSRVRKAIDIVLIGPDAQGRDFMEQTKTVLLSRHGAGIVSQHKLVVEQELILVQVASNKEAEIRIVGQLGSAEGFYTYGVAFLNPQPEFWPVEFASNATAEAPTSIALQCDRCGLRETLAPNTIELDIYALNGEMLRDCKSCKNSTRWIAAAAAVESQPASRAVDSSGPASTSSKETQIPPAPRVNRRKHPRVKVNFTACVRRPGSADELVRCENVSRGGVCFKTNQRLSEASRIEVAAPYSAGSAPILVPAQIVHVEELVDEKMFRCRVRYLDSKNQLGA